jgi:hypothetical protein
MKNSKKAQEKPHKILKLEKHTIQKLTNSMMLSIQGGTRVGCTSIAGQNTCP